MTTLLVGGTGFLGSYVARRLRERDVVALARGTSDRSTLPKDMPVRTGDLDDPSSVDAVLEGVDTLVYCASMGFGHIPGLVPRLERAGVRRAVFVSTTSIFTTLPARSRAPRVQAEDAVQGSQLEWTILRPTMIYGSGRDRNICRLLRFLRRFPVFPVFGNGRALQQPVYVEDLADGVVAALDAPRTGGRVYNLPGAAPLSYVDLVRTAARAVGRAPVVAHVPRKAALLAARLVTVLPIPSFLTVEQVLRLAEDKTFDYAEAVRDFGFRPRSFAEGVALEARSLGFAAPSASPDPRAAHGA